MRFSLAHELGHLLLHRDIVAAARIDSVEGWVSYYDNIPEKDYGFLEYHANEFAGRLLVPHNELKQDLAEARRSAIGAGATLEQLNSELGRVSIASSLHRKYGVSSDVMARRLSREEEIWPFKL